MTRGARAAGAGRTSWHPRDAAEHERELLVELADEFGAAAHAVSGVLKDLAQAQRADGAVLTGFRVLAAKSHLHVDLESAAAARARAREIVERAAAIGWIDDLVIDDDGRRFSCRISGWGADQARGRAAIRKAGQRTQDDDEVGHVPSEGDKGPESVPDERDNAPLVPPPVDNAPVVPLEGDVSRSVPLHNQTRPVLLQEEDARVPPGAGMGAVHPQLQEVIDILAAAPGLVVEPMAVNSALRAKPAGDAVAAAHTVASWAHEGHLAVTAANRLLHSALDKQTTAEAVRDKTVSQARPPAAARGRRESASDRAAAARAKAARLREQRLQQEASAS